MDISIILVTRNTRSLLERALLSIRDSQDAYTKEVVVVDNGSTDGTAAMVSQQFPEVLYLPQADNLGFARANNLGAARGRGRWLLLLNSDARLQSDSLAVAMKLLDNNACVGAAGVQLLNTDGSLQNSIANAPTLATELLNRSLLRRLFPRRYLGKQSGLQTPTPVESVIGACLFVRREVWTALRGLDESYFFFFEETDFCVRARASGHLVWHLPMVRVWHDQGQTARRVNLAARVEFWISRYHYFSVHHPLAAQWFLRVGLCLRLLGSVGGNALLFPIAQRWREKWRVQWHLLLWHLRGCPRSWGINPNYLRPPGLT